MDDVDVEAVPQAGDSREDWWRDWTLVYALNLGPPLLLVLTLLEEGGGVGMLFGLAVAWAAGLAVCSWPGHVRSALVSGGAVVAAFQFLPVPQLVALVFALVGWNAAIELTGAFKLANHAMGREVSGLAVTLMTAFPLMLLALGFGYVWRWKHGYPGAARDEAD